ncbi:MAG: YihY/virulence factor BrkB family protein [Roseobacter sp.]
MTRGRHAQQPIHIPPKGWTDIALRVKDEVNDDQVGLIAAGIAFYGLLALFPAITAVMALAGLVAEPEHGADQINLLNGLLPSQVIDIIYDQASEVTGSRESGLGLAALLSFGVALYSASKGTASLMEGMNAAYDETESRGIMKKFAVRIGLTAFIVLGMFAGLAVTLVVPAVASFVEAGPFVETLGMFLVYAVLFALAVAGLALIYRYAPSRDNAEFSWVSPGAIVACTAWIFALASFAFYVKSFGTYNEIFGTLGGVIVLLVWFWISAFIVLLGAELNAEAEAQTRHDTTIGQGQPMGSRGAVKADLLGDAHVT